MNNLKQELQPFSTGLCIDSGLLNKKNKFLPFGLTDALTAYSGEENQPFIHFWQLDQTMILGMKDTRVTDLASGLQVLNEAHYEPIVRNSGGLGVIADSGILNVSLILPNKQKKVSIDEAYTFMWSWIKDTFEVPNKQIEAYEITSSYCPGTFDLSIKGKKFAGIAQRRIKNGIAIMIYLSINGNQPFRGELVKHFYQASLKEAFGKNGYPPVDPKVMSNLNELLDRPLTINEAKKELLTTMAEFITIDTEKGTKLIQSVSFEGELSKQLDKMLERNQLLKEQ